MAQFLAADASSDTSIQSLIQLSGQSRLENINAVPAIPDSECAALLSDSIRKYCSLGTTHLLNTSSVLAFLPVFGEISHHNCLGSLYANSKYGWLESIYKQSSLEGIPLAIRPHPHTSRYGQEDLTSHILNHLENTYKPQVTYLNTSQEFNVWISDHPSVPFSFNGSISLELSLLGKPSVISGDNIASQLSMPPLIHYLGSSLQSTVSHYWNTAIEVTASQQNLDRDLRAYQAYSLIGKYFSVDRIFRKLFDKFFFFGHSTNASNSAELLAFYIKSYHENFIHKSIKTRGFEHLFCILA